MNISLFNLLLTNTLTVFKYFAYKLNTAAIIIRIRNIFVINIVV